MNSNNQKIKNHPPSPGIEARTKQTEVSLIKKWKKDNALIPFAWPCLQQELPLSKASSTHNTHHEQSEQYALLQCKCITSVIFQFNGCSIFPPYLFVNSLPGTELL